MQRIAERFAAMLKAGLEDEVLMLRQKYRLHAADLPSMRCVGYRQVWEVQDGPRRAAKCATAASTPPANWPSGRSPGWGNTLRPNDRRLPRGRRDERVARLLGGMR
jgi:hypothetical protein